jgi:hypothetical protein
MDVKYLLLLFFLVSCLPEAQVGKGQLSTGTTDTGTNPNSSQSNIPDGETQWNYLGTSGKTISINASNLNNAYLTGKEIETFLNTSTNFGQDYCLVSRYSVSGIAKELRSRIVPISYYDFSAKRTVKIFRVDFNDVGNSNSECVSSPTLPLKVLDPNGILALDASIPSPTFNPNLLCPLCTSNLTSTKLMIFKKQTVNLIPELQQLKLSEVNISGLSLSVDPNNNTSLSTGTCSQTQCVARGFDCCLENQCINDGAIRPSAQTQYSSEIQAAEQERISNPLAYLNYPHLYYICGTSPGSSTTGGSSGSYDQGLTQLKKDYFCVEHMKKNKTGFSFHQDVMTALTSGIDFFTDDTDITDIPGQSSTLYPLDIECRNNQSTASQTSEMNFLKVTERLYKNCGCSKTTLSDMIAYCPAYEYSVNYFESTGLPNRIDCLTPDSTTPQIPTQQTVSVNSKSAPHRYFRICGDEFGSGTNCSGGDAQEGDVFEYQDEGKILPVQDHFGMNAILGQMNVTLDKALPAKTVDVELDQVYQLSTTSGFYTPCPSCGKDSWFNSLSAFPSSGYGTGLQAVGHSTSRDGYDNNSTGGNYEDTIFGRACWIPPTMIPFSHKAGSTTQSQRLARLRTQAALFSNGYQRDWFGFNKGALIGSFDGVSWFAIGKGRIVKSTSKKLFLAINAPFADLASATLHVVNVQSYDGISQAAQVDYDPQYHNSHPYQNEAGNCQANHLCSTDTDCVTRLGWEYMCANVQDLKTQWPVFDVNAKEKAAESTVLTIDQVLLQKRFPSSSTKRCVYRGSGALCVQTPGNISDMNKRKTLTCAPNFYCANINSAGSVFNSKISRYGASLEEIPVTRNHLFGKDANILGRPLSYVASSQTTSLPADIRQNIQANLLQYEPGATSTSGLCLPGKSLPEASNQTVLVSPFEQHKAPDTLGRTDFISQISSCNSGLFTSYRYSSCPVIGADGNYEFLSSGFNPANYQLRARNQNSCGLDTLFNGTNLNSSADNLLASSPFKAIESKTLANQTVIEPSFARDACLRRAGQVCHTDLDCGPNKMHATQADNYSLNYFGNEAEKKYYTEYLVCGQADSKPSLQDTLNYKNFQMSKNVCCREVGSDLSTHTSYVPTSVNPNSASNQNTSLTDDTYDRLSFGLKTTLAPGMSPSDPFRYSRLATVENLGTPNRPGLSAFQDKSGANLTTAQGLNVMTPYQWKTLSEANSESCCGGGWIRKFSDGSNDWTKRDRLYIDVKNFTCINSRTSLLTHPEDFAGAYPSAGDVINLVNQDMGSYCKDNSGTKGSCALNSITDSINDVGPSTDIFIGPSTTSDISHYKTYGIDFSNSLDYYFYPRSADSDSEIIIDNAKIGANGGRANITIKIPSFITHASFDNHIASYADGVTSIWQPNARVHMYNIAAGQESSNAGPCVKKSSLLTSLAYPTTDGGGGRCSLADGAECCYAFDAPNRILKVVPASNGTFGVASSATKKMAIKLINAAPAGFGSSITRNKPGSNTHYLKRLGKLELTGIPQISYEALTCSDNAERLVPGIFKKILKLDFDQPDFSFIQTLIDPDTGVSATSRFTNRHGLEQEPIFSENDFKCCTPLGKTNKDQTKCCSGYGVAAGNTFTCALPGGTDLMVYFNRFVSNEGVGSDKPGGGLGENDFNFITGEPKISTTVNQKISALGKAYCESKKVRQGGAFGEFPLEPVGNETNLSEKIYGIVDSARDEGKVSSAGATIPVGYTAFMAGFRWNHHLYCQD